MQLCLLQGEENKAGLANGIAPAYAAAIASAWGQNIQGATEV